MAHGSIQLTHTTNEFELSTEYITSLEECTFTKRELKKVLGTNKHAYTDKHSTYNVDHLIQNEYDHYIKSLERDFPASTEDLIKFCKTHLIHKDHYVFICHELRKLAYKKAGYRGKATFVSNATGDKIYLAKLHHSHYTFYSTDFSTVVKSLFPSPKNNLKEYRDIFHQKIVLEAEGLEEASNTPTPVEESETSEEAKEPKTPSTTLPSPEELKAIKKSNITYTPIKETPETKPAYLADTIFILAVAAGFILPLLYNAYILIAKSLSLTNSGITSSNPFYNPPLFITLIILELIALYVHFFVSDVSKTKKIASAIPLGISIIFSLIAICYITYLYATFDPFSETNTQPSPYLLNGAPVCALIALISSLFTIRRAEGKRIILLIRNIIYMLILFITTSLLSNLSPILALIALLLPTYYVISSIKKEIRNHPLKRVE